MPSIDNLVHQQSTTTGTGNLTVTAVTSRLQFSTRFNTGASNTFYYFVTNQGADEWEYGSGYMSNSTVLVRDTVIESSAGASSAENFSAGTKDITCDLPAENQIDRNELIGISISWPTNTPPAFALAEDGSAYDRTTYADLYDVIGISYGNTSGTNFLVPDKRGHFERGWDNGAGNDPDAASRTDRGDGTSGDNVGTKQTDQFKSHVHLWGNRTASRASGGSQTVVGSGSDFNTTASGGNETRPLNINVLKCIIYR